MKAFASWLVGAVDRARDKMVLLAPLMHDELPLSFSSGSMQATTSLMASNKSPGSNIQMRTRISRNKRSIYVWGSGSKTKTSTEIDMFILTLTARPKHERSDNQRTHSGTLGIANATVLKMMLRFQLQGETIVEGSLKHYPRLIGTIVRTTLSEHNKCYRYLNFTSNHRHNISYMSLPLVKSFRKAVQCASKSGVCGHTIFGDLAIRHDEPHRFPQPTQMTFPMHPALANQTHIEHIDRDVGLNRCIL